MLGGRPAGRRGKPAGLPHHFGSDFWQQFYRLKAQRAALRPWELATERATLSAANRRNLVMLGNLSRRERARVKGDLVQFPFEVEQAVVASADEDGLFARRHRMIECARHLRLRAPIEVHTHFRALPHEHDVMPRAQTKRRASDKEFVALVSVE